MGATPSHENDGDDVAGTDSDDDDDIIKMQPNVRYRVSHSMIIEFEMVIIGQRSINNG